MKLPRLKVPRPTRPRRTFTDAMEVTGLGCLVADAWWWQPQVGLATLGLVLLYIGWAVGE